MPSRSMNETGPGRRVTYRHTRPQPASDKRKMRVGVGGLDRTLLSGQLSAAIEIVVLIPGAFRKNGRKEIDVRPNPLRV